MICFVKIHEYNDWWIKGRYLEEVEARYGEFDIKWGNTVGYFIGKGQKLIMSDNLDRYYYMKYDDSRIIYEVYKRVQPGG